ncbi:MAG: RNA-binding protein [Alphaproteobacteria bacterium]|nr:MAG: RNA-binding protein [Alphaproteobacteria bacterium]
MVKKGSAVSLAEERVETRVPERRCIATAQTRPQAELLRFVVGPENQIVPDVTGKLPGRGLWLTPTREALALALKKKAFARAAKAQVAVPDGLEDLIERLLVARAIEGLALARRAGAIVCGFQKVENALRQAPPAALFEASDGAADGRSKLLALAKRWQKEQKQPIPVLGCLNSEELGLAFGRGSVIHAALEKSGIAPRILSDFTRLGGFRPMTPEAWGGEGAQG